MAQRTSFLIASALSAGMLAAGAAPASVQEPPAQLSTAPKPVDPTDASRETLAISEAAAAPHPNESRPLGPVAAHSAISPAAESERSTDSLVWWLRTAFALAVVISLIFILKICLEKLARRSGGLASALGAGGRAPSGVLEIMGRYPVARGQTLVLLRMDRRILLLCQTSAGFSTLSEITDTDEVASLIVKTRDESGETLSSRFGEMLQGLERDPSVIAEHDAGDPVRPAPEQGLAAALSRFRSRLSNSKGVGA